MLLMNKQSSFDLSIKSHSCSAACLRERENSGSLGNIYSDIFLRRLKKCVFLFFFFRFFFPSLTPCTHLVSFVAHRPWEAALSLNSLQCQVTGFKSRWLRKKERKKGKKRGKKKVTKDEPPFFKPQLHFILCHQLSSHNLSPWALLTQAKSVFLRADLSFQYRHSDYMGFNGNIFHRSHGNNCIKTH